MTCQPAKIYTPLTVDETNLVATNLTEVGTEWDVATTYAANDEVYVTDAQAVYVSAIDSNVGNDPSLNDPTVWIYKGAMNKWAAFDAFVANPASNTGTITYQITVGSPVTAISFFGLHAQSLQVVASLGGNSQTYDVELRDLSYINGSWFNWFYGGRQNATEYTIANLSYFGAGTVLDITIDSGSLTGTAEVGQIVMGKQEEIGEVLAGARLRMKPYSRYVEDEFGNLTVVKRPTVNIYDIDLAIQTDKIARSQKLFKDVEGKATVFIGNDNPDTGLILFGVLVAAETIIDHKEYHTAKIQFREFV